MFTCIIAVLSSPPLRGQVCDIPVNHPSCSKQHAVLQYRIMEYEKPDGTTGKRVR